jgi:hypothetical protein
MGRLRDVHDDQGRSRLADPIHKIGIDIPIYQTDAMASQDPLTSFTAGNSNISVCVCCLPPKSHLGH